MKPDSRPPKRLSHNSTPIEQRPVNLQVNRLLSVSTRVYNTCRSSLWNGWLNHHFIFLPHVSVARIGFLPNVLRNTIVCITSIFEVVFWIIQNQTVVLPVMMPKSSRKKVVKRDLTFTDRKKTRNYQRGRSLKNRDLKNIIVSWSGWFLHYSQFY